MTSVQLKEPKKNAANLVFVSIIRNLAKQSLKDKVKRKSRSLEFVMLFHSTSFFLTNKDFINKTLKIMTHLIW